MTIRRRDLILAGLGFGLALFPRPPWLRAAPILGRDVAPDGGHTDQTAALQRAADAAAQSGRPLFLPPGVYATRGLQLTSGAHIVGVPGRSILRSQAASATFGINRAKDVRIEGLVVDGGAGGPVGALLEANEVELLEVVNCRFVGSHGDGLVLRRVSGRVADCDIGGCRNVAIVGEDPQGLEIVRNRIHDCGDVGILVRRSTAGETGRARIADNVIHRVATGVAIDSRVGGARLAVVQANLIRDLFFRKTVEPHGNGIVVDADSIVRGNVIENVPGYGIVAGRARRLRDVTVTDNVVRQAYIGIGIRAHRPDWSALAAGNLISGAVSGAVRALYGPGPCLVLS